MKIKKIVLNWLAVLIWMGVIYYFSSQPNLKSELEPIWDLIFRKIAHMAEFFILAHLLFKAYQSHGLSVKKSLFFAFIIALAYATADEWHQSQIAGRVASIIDVGIDGFGALFFIFLKLVEKPVKLNNV